MRALSLSVVAVLLLAAPAAVAVDPDEWTGTSVTAVKLLRTPTTSAFDIGWIDDTVASFSSSATAWTLTLPLTGEIQGTLRPAAAGTYRLRSEDAGVTTWLAKAASPGGGTEVIASRAGLRGTLLPSPGGGGIELRLRGRFSGVFSKSYVIGQPVRGTVRIRMTGTRP